VSAAPADNNNSAISATYLSILSTEFDAMHAAITIALPDLRFLSCKSMSSMGLTPLSSMMGSARPSILQSTRGNQCQRPPMLTTKRAHLDLRWRGSGCALERGECLVDLEGFGNVMGAFCAEVVLIETVRVKQGATTNCQRPPPC
jgi:hypothetical protein